MENLTVKLSQLRLSPLNVRHVKPSAIERMADNIAAHGIIHALACYEEDGLYYVFAGGRRFRGLQLLKKRKAITGTHQVPITIRSKDEAVSLSTAENAEREDMHPADRVRAFTAMRDLENRGADEIAARFGYSQGYVIQMLRLGSLAPALLNALSKDALSVESAKALAITEDQEKQAEAFKRCGNNPHQIRAYLTSEKIGTHHKLFIFVGKEAYEEAGGFNTLQWASPSPCAGLNGIHADMIRISTWSL